MSDRSHASAGASADRGSSVEWTDPADPRRESISVGVALGDLCAEHTAHIAAALQRNSHRHRGVHEARKGIRRLRSALALGAPCFGAAGRKIDRALQRLGRSLSKLRDAHVAVELARGRVKRCAEAEPCAIWRYAHALLVLTRARELRRALKRDADFAQRGKVLARCAQAVALLPWHQLDPATLSAQLASSRQRADRAAARSEKDHGLSRLHRLRKRLRRHRMQATALAALLAPQARTPVHAPPGFRASVAAYASTLDEISSRVDAIGARLDTSLLRNALRSLPRSHERKAALSLLKRDPL